MLSKNLLSQKFVNFTSILYCLYENLIYFLILGIKLYKCIFFYLYIYAVPLILIVFLDKIYRKVS